VRWLDRYRHVIALGAALAAAPFLITEVGDTLGADWPSMHSAMLSAILGMLVWWTTEVGLVYVTALWETEHARLLRGGGLPRAIIRRRW
jgi:membrane-associated phospholipid phosphatase